MTITCNTKAPWSLQDTYLKISSGNLCYQQAGTLWVWGTNSRGELGLNDTVQRSSPVQVPGTQWIRSGFFPMAPTLGGGGIKTDGTLWVWGDRAQGRLGQNDCIYYSSPVQVPGTQWKFLSVSRNHNLSLKTDNTLWVWGSNEGGKLGTNSDVNVHRSSPIQVPGSEWLSVSAGLTTSHAIKADNTLWAWGGNYCGRLGIDSTLPRSSPVQIPGTQWCFVSGSYSAVAAIKTDGTLWVWGSNISGELGLNTSSTAYFGMVSSPTQVPGTQWVEVYVGGDTSQNNSNSVGRKSDGTLWTWGGGGDGSIGDNTTIPRSSPVQVPGTQWVSAASRSRTVVARKSDNTLYAWGRNISGQLGNNNTISQCIPIQVPGSQWIDAVSGGSVFAIKAC